MKPAPGPARRWVWILVLSTLATGCAPRRAPETPQPGSAHALRATCKGRILVEGKTHRFESAFALSAPDRLHAEIGGRIGGPRAVLTLQGDRLLIVIPADRTYLLEEASPGVLEHLLGVRIEARDLVEVLNAAGTRRSWRVAGGGGRGFLIRADGDRVLVDPDPPGTAPFGGLELRFRDIDRSGADSAGTLFDLNPPPGWDRLRVDPDGLRDGPLLLP